MAHGRASATSAKRVMHAAASVRFFDMARRHCSSPRIETEDRRIGHKAELVSHRSVGKTSAELWNTTGPHPSPIEISG